MSAANEELYSLLVPLAEDRLIVPRACVVEVVRYTRPERPGGSESWMLGTINWSGRELPLGGAVHVEKAELVIAGEETVRDALEDFDGVDLESRRDRNGRHGAPILTARGRARNSACNDATRIQASGSRARIVPVSRSGSSEKPTRLPSRSMSSFSPRISPTIFP